MRNSAATPKILIYQGEECGALIDYLTNANFSIITCNTDDVLVKINRKDYDLCILDHYKISYDSMLLEPLKLLRKLDDKIPAIILSDKNSSKHIIEAFDEGADDYIIKPFNFEELIRRIKAILKRCGIRVRKIEPQYNIGNYIFNVVNSTLTIDGTEINLNKKTNQVLSLLCAYKNEILPNGLLMQQVWLDDNYYNKRSLDVYMCELRNLLKLDKKVIIKTIRGVGFSLMVEE